MSTLNVSNKANITLIRGDTYIRKIDIYLIDENGNVVYDDAGNPKLYVPAESDNIRFALKETFSDKKPLILKEIPNDTMILRLDSTDTKHLTQPGSYVYDMQITMDDGSEEGYVLTFLRGKVKLIEEVY